MLFMSTNIFLQLRHCSVLFFRIVFVSTDIDIWECALAPVTELSTKSIFCDAVIMPFVTAVYPRHLLCFFKSTNISLQLRHRSV